MFLNCFRAGWRAEQSMAERITAVADCDALKMVLWRRKLPKGVILYSDRGS